MNQAPKGLAGFGVVLLSYVLGVAVLATLAPFEFQVVSEAKFGMRWSVRDLVLNLLLLFPAGFLYRLSRDRPRDPRCLDALLLGCGLSMALELAQLFIPSRYSSPIDVLTNGLGAWAGAYVYEQIGPWFDRQLAGQLTLRLPLVNLLYLVTPIMWFDGLAAKPPSRILLGLPLAAFFAGIAVSLWRNRMKLPGWSAHRVAMGVSIWFALATLPGAFRAANSWSFTVVCAYGLTRFYAAWVFPKPRPDRRFELPTLRRMVPLFAIYVLAQSLWPLEGMRSEWIGSLALPGMGLSSHHHVFVILEHILAFTVIGYLAAELAGRKQRTMAPGLLTGLLAGVLCGALVEGLRGFMEGHQASLSALALAVCGALWGAAIYRSQLIVVRTILGRDPKWGSIPPPTD